MQHQKDVATIAGGVTSVVAALALGADPAAIGTWFWGAIDGIVGRIQAGYAINRNSAMTYLSRHARLNNATVVAQAGSLDVARLRKRLEIEGPIGFKRSIAAGKSTDDAIRSMSTNMAGVADEAVRDGDRDVITQTAARGQGVVGWRRRLTGKSCGFCAMLASRGAVYVSRRTAMLDRSGERFHKHCDCWCEPLYRRQDEPPEVRRLQAQWRRVTAGHSGRDAQRVWMRHWDRATPRARQRMGLPAQPGGTTASPGAGTQVRQILQGTQSAEDVSRVLAAELKRTTGRDIRVDLRGSVETAREHAEGVLRVAERYPDVAINEVVTDRLLLAYAEWDNGRLIFSTRYSSLDRRQRYLSELAGDADAKWHPYSDPVGMAVHEMGHALDVGTLNRSIRAQLDEIMSAGDAARVSGYATQNVDEFVAEAFADVLMNGPRANALSRQVVDLLDDAYRARGVPGTGRGLATPDLSRMTVADLKALAKERGVTGYTRMRKPELLEALGAPVVPAKVAVKAVKKAAAPAKKAAKAAPAKKAATPRKATQAPQFNLQRAAAREGVTDAQLAEIRELIRIHQAPIIIGKEADEWIERSFLHTNPEIAAFFREHPDIYNHLAQQVRIEQEWVNAWGAARLAEARGTATAAVRRAVRPSNPVVVRTGSEDHLRQILSSGRVRTQFETGTSSGFIDTQLRADFEGMVFGLARDLPVGSRPVYGYVAVGGLRADAGTRLAQFGEVRIVLRDRARSRTTVSVGDSLDDRKLMTPMPIDEADWRAVRPSLAETRLDSPGFRDAFYVEAQIHGGVTLDDIAEVVFRSQPEPATVAALQRAGVAWRVEGRAAKAAAKATKAAPAKKATKAAAPPAPQRMSIAALKTELERAGVTVPPRIAKPALVDEVTALRGGASAREITERLSPPRGRIIDRSQSPADILQQETQARAAALAAPPVKLQQLRGADAAVLKYYQRHGDAHMLGLMRRGRVGSAPGFKGAPLTVEQVWESIDKIRRLMDRSVLTEPVVVYRGMAGFRSVFRGAGEPGSLVGRTFRDKGFVSTSADRRLAMDFMAGEGWAADGILLEIRVPPGVRAVQVSNDEFAGIAPTNGGVSEREILLQDGLRFRIISDEMVDDVYRWTDGARTGEPYRHVVVEVIP